MPPRAPTLRPALSLLLALRAGAAPVANPDTGYTVPEDGTLSAAGVSVLLGDFNPTSPVPFDGNWSVQRGLTNGNNGTPVLGYPSDASGKSWTHPAFNPATSSPGTAWISAAAPLVGPAANSIDLYTNTTASVVFPGGANYTTYLLRNTLTLSAAQAASSSWRVTYLVDDGAVTHVNGQPSFRINMSPTSTVTTTTFASSSGPENVLTEVPVNLGGLLVPGTNTVAIELHQAATLSDAGFNMVWQEDPADGFVYADDAFGTNSAAYESGSNLATDGDNGTAGLHVRCGQTPNLYPNSLSGAWTRSFSVAQPGSYTVQVRYRLTANATFEANEIQAAVVELDGSRLGTAFPAVGSAPAITAVNRLIGTGGQYDTSWQTFSQNVTLSAGAHTLALGLYLNRATAGNEYADVYYDDLSITSVGGAGSGSVLANDSGTPPLTAQLATPAGHGTLSLGSDGNFTYTPAANYFGADSFTYRAIDATGTSAPATVSITITPVNDAPGVTADAHTTPEDTLLTVGAPGVLGNDTDPDGDALTAVLRATTPNGSLALAPDGSFTYQPNPNFSGTDSFTYRANDGQANSADQTVTITVTPVNDAPLANADAYRTGRDTTLTVSLPNTAGQTPVEETLVAAGLPVAIGSPEESGLPVWRYLDNGSNQGTAWREPAFDDTAWSSGLAELGYGDAGEGRPERTLVGYGPDANNRHVTTYFRSIFEVTGSETLTNLKIRLLRDDAAAVYLNGHEIYRDQSANGFPNLPANPAYNQFSSGSISAADEAALRDLSAFLTPNSAQFLVEGVNVVAVEVHQATAASSDVSFDLELKADRLPYAGVLANDTDPEGSALTAQLVSPPAHGSLALGANGTFTYTPQSLYLGPDSFTYRATDGGATSAVATVSIEVTAGVNQAPVAAVDAATVAEDALLTVGTPGVLGNDTDANGDALIAVLVSTVTNGTLSLASNGGFTYQPGANFHGTDGFSYRAQDTGGKQSATTRVNLTVTPVNDAPVAAADSYGTEPGLALTVPAGTGVLANDTDVDGGGLTALLGTPPVGGGFSFSANGGFTYAPPPGFSGLKTFTYRATDGIATSAFATVQIVINGRPVANPDAYAAWEDTPLAVSAASGVLANDTDPEAQPLAATLVTPPAHGTLAGNADGSFTYSPARDFAGMDTLTYAATDGLRVSASATVTITVLPRNDPPVAAPDSHTVTPGGILTVPPAVGLLANDSDPDGDALTAELVDPPAKGVLYLQADGGFTYEAFVGQSGDDSYSYRVRDGSLFSAMVENRVEITAPGKDLVINEIMYRPGGGYPELTSREYIELFNRGGQTLDLTGWTISSGVTFAFPTGTVIRAGSHLVVAANLAAFQTAYPGVTNVVAGWTGTLSNSGETLRLTDAAGNDQDSVFFSSEGDWAQRTRETTFGGWAWTTLADGGGRSMELRNPWLDNGNGQNWAVSQAIGGSPGRANDALTSNLPPMVRDLEHAPAVPKPADPVLITFSPEDENPPASLVATLFWRDATTTTPGAFSAVPMTLDPRDRFLATLPPRANLAIVEFYVAVSDGVNTRTWPAPTSEGQNANCQFQVSAEVPSATAETVRLVLTAAENAAYTAEANTSDRKFNQTMVMTRGDETAIRYSCDMRIRGNSSRNYQFRPLRVTIPADRDWDGLTTFMLNPKAPHLQYLGMRLFQQAGLRAPNPMPVELRRNGVEYTTSTGSTPDYGLWVLMEDIGGDFVKKHWPLADTGNVYKKGRPDWYWRSTQAAPATPQGLLDGWSKQNNSAVNDWTDLRDFFSVWQTAAAPHFPGTTAGNLAASGGSATSGNGNWAGTALSSNQLASVATVSDLAQWARWFAVMTILQDNETNISNGQDDDYAAYLRPAVVDGTPRLLYELLPHDLDTIFGLGDSPLAANARGLYDMTAESSVFRPLLPLIGTTNITGNATFRALYHGALRDLLGDEFNADTTASANPPFHQLVDFHLGSWAPAGTRTQIKNFMTQRRTHLLGLLGAAAIAPGTADSIPTWTSSVTNGLVISEVLANNVSAYLNGGLYPDVIELWNNGAATVSLAGMSLTDDPLVKAKYVFPSGTTLAPGARLVVHADTNLAAIGLHTGFALDADGDSVHLYDTVANGQGLLDAVTFGLQVADRSVARGPVSGVWSLAVPTIGAANTVVTALGPASGLRINEWLGNADYRAANDFIEVYNPSTNAVALTGMVLTDDPVNFPGRAPLAALSFIAPGGFIAFEPRGAGATPGNARELPFNLSSRSGTLALLGQNGVVADRVDNVNQFRDVATGRVPDGSGTLSALTPPTPGFTNAPLPDGSTDILDHLRITELMYNPASSTESEFIELRNNSHLTGTPVTLDLSGVRFTRGITYTFPVGLTLAPGEFVLLVQDSARFNARFPGVPVTGVYSGSLANGGERVRFELAGAQLSVLDFTYSDNWYPVTDGGGSSLQVVDETAPPAAWDTAAGWMAAAPNPGALPSFGVNAGPDRTVFSGQRVILDPELRRGGFAATAITTAWSQEAGPVAATFTTPTHPVANVVFPQPGLYTLRFTATATGPTNASDTVLFTVTDSYEGWAARTLAGQPAGQVGRLDDADFDGWSNLAEFVLGSDPALGASRPVVQEAWSGGAYRVSWSRNRLADPAIQVIAEMATDLNAPDWTSDPGNIGSALMSLTPTQENWEAVDLSPADERARRYFRLRILSP